MRRAADICHPHHRDDAGDAAAERRQRYGKQLLLDGRQLFVERHGKRHDCRLEPELNVTAILVVGVVRDVVSHQKHYDQRDGYKYRVEQRKARAALYQLR